MDELVNLVQQKTGISQDQAKTAVTTVLDYLKQHLPQPVASQVDNVVNNPGASKAMNDLLGGKL